MALSITFNPFIGKFDYITAGVTIPEVVVDPTNPATGETWVLVTPPSFNGTPLGLLLAITHTNSVFTYQLSYHTTEDTIVRVPLT